MCELGSGFGAGSDHGPPGPEAWKRLRAPRTYICNVDLILVLFLLLPWKVNCVRTDGRNEMPFGKNFRWPQIFSLEISGPKVVLLCKFSTYRAVRALRLQSHQPHGWSGPENQPCQPTDAALPLLYDLHMYIPAATTSTEFRLSKFNKTHVTSQQMSSKPMPPAHLDTTVLFCAPL